MSNTINITRPTRRAFKPFKTPVMRGKRRKFAPARTIVVHKAPHRERKFFDTSQAAASTTGWVVNNNALCIPTAGTGNQNRIGSKITIQALHMKMFLSINAVESAATPNPMIMARIIIGVAHNGGTVVTTDVIDTGASSQLLAWRQVDEVSQFTILTDFYIIAKPQDVNEGAVNVFANGTTISEVVKFTKVWKNGLPKKFITASDIATRNSLFLMAVSTATGAVLNIETRCRFTDD